jgi:DNA repair protein RadD
VGALLKKQAAIICWLKGATMTFNLRPYQLEAEHETRLALARGNRRVVMYLPTGGGKTLTAISIIMKAVAKGRRVVFTANRKQLVRQTSEKLTEHGIAHGILQADNTCRLHEMVMVASIDTVHVRGLPDDVGLLIIDECHAVAGSKKYRSLLAKYNLVPVVGLSATPFSIGLGKHYDELGGHLFERLVIGATITELIDGGHLVDCDIYAPSEPDLKAVKSSKGIDGLLDYNQSDLEEATDKPELIGDILAHWRKLASGKQTVVFATSIPHSKHIVETFQTAGVSAEHLDYWADDDERAEILGRFARGEITVLSNVALLAEGWDAPATEVMILARPTRSLIRFVQMVGRVLRPAPGKERALLLDHSGSTARLGHPCDDLPLELDDGRPNSSKAKKVERTEPLPKPCPKCHFVKPAKVHECPNCGFKPERQTDVVVADGELVQLKRKKPVAKDAKQHVFSQLLFIERQRGYRHGWAANQYRSIFDVWPRGLSEVTATPTQEVLNKVRANQIAYSKRKESSHAAA